MFGEGFTYTFQKFVTIREANYTRILNAHLERPRNNMPMIGKTCIRRLQNEKCANPSYKLLLFFHHYGIYGKICQWFLILFMSMVSNKTSHGEIRGSYHVPKGHITLMKSAYHSHAM